MKTDKALLAGGLAVLALLAHVALPFVNLEYTGEESTSRTYWPGGLAEREETFDPVTGASMSYALTGIIIFVVGFGVFAAARYIPEAWRWYSMAGAAGVGTIGASLALHSQGLWLGRGIATIIHKILGSDAPAHRFMGPEMSPDYYTSVMPISPWLVVPAIVAAVWFAVAALAREVSPEKRHHEQALRHARTVQWLFVASAIMLVVPWAMENTADRGPEIAGERDSDPFAISLYDAERLHADSVPIADAAGEPGLTEYDFVASTGRTMASFILVPALIGLVGIVGVKLIVNEQKVLGRTIQYIAAGLGSFVLLLRIIGIILVAGFLYGANDQISSDPAWAPLTAALALGASFVFAVAAIRQLGAERDSLIADRFPEPIIYD